MKVYCVFLMYGDGDHYLTDSLESIHKTVEGALNSVSAEEIEKRYGKHIDLAHESMCKENNYTYVGNRKDLNCFDAAYEYFHGFVIEEIEMQE